MGFLQKLIAILYIAGLIGWGMNVYKLTQSDFKAPYKNESIRLVSIFVFPLGAIVGYFDIEDVPENVQ